MGEDFVWVVEKEAPALATRLSLGDKVILTRTFPDGHTYRFDLVVTAIPYNPSGKFEGATADGTILSFNFENIQKVIPRGRP